MNIVEAMGGVAISFAHEVAKTLKEYADMILHRNASNLPIEKFTDGDITVTVVAGFSNYIIHSKNYWPQK